MSESGLNLAPFRTDPRYVEALTAVDDHLLFQGLPTAAQNADGVLAIAEIDSDGGAGLSLHGSGDIITRGGPTPLLPSHLFLIYVLSAGTGTDREIFVFPIKEFNRLIDLAITRGSKKGGTKKAMYISRSKADTGRWFMRKVGGKMERITEENCIEVSRFRKAFHLLDLTDTKGKVRSS